MGGLPALIDVGTVDEFDEGRLRLVKVRTMEIGVMRWRGEWFAVRNICPHHAGPLCEGIIGPSLVADGGDGFAGVESRPVVACAWHRWEFDMRTGECMVDPALRAKTYPVVVDGSRVSIALPGGARRGEAVAQ